MVSLVFFDILQLPHTVISNSEKLTHPNVQFILYLLKTLITERYIFTEYIKLPCTVPVLG